MKAAIQRIVKDLTAICSSDYVGIIGYAAQKNGHPLVVETCVFGPSSTRYKDALLLFELEFPDDYPFASPKIIFIAGANRRDILLVAALLTNFYRAIWTPIYTIKDILYDILTVLELLYPMNLNK